MKYLILLTIYYLLPTMAELPKENAGNIPSCIVGSACYVGCGSNFNWSCCNCTPTCVNGCCYAKCSLEEETQVSDAIETELSSCE